MQLLHMSSGWCTEEWPADRGSHETVMCVQASMLEIYNEEYKDLLGKALPAGKKHQVKHRVCLSSAVLALYHLLHPVSHACADPSTVGTVSLMGLSFQPTQQEHLAMELFDNLW